MVEVCLELCFDNVNIVPADLHAECADFLSKYSFFIQDRYNPIFSRVAPDYFLVIVIASIGFIGNSEPESNETTVEVSATEEITKESTTEQSTEEETMVTDDFLELEEYEYLWNEVIIDFGDLGKVKKSKEDIIDGSYGKYFDITEIER